MPGEHGDSQVQEDVPSSGAIAPLADDLISVST